MERVEELPGLEVVRDANDHFRNFFARFGGVPVEGDEEELRAMLQLEGVLRSVGALLAAGLSNSRTPEMQSEFREYRDNLRRLREELKRMEVSAHACRDRLFSREQHLQATRAWCAAARATH